MVRHQLDTVPRSRYLGEVAIVDGSSRVRRTGITYGEMLYDENIGSHVAWGNGFTAAIKGTAGLPADARIDSGLNQSPVHVDVVLGDSEVRTSRPARADAWPPAWPSRARLWTTSTAGNG